MKYDINFVINYNLGATMLEKKNIEKAKYYLEALEADKYAFSISSFFVIHKLGYLYTELKEYEKANTSCIKAQNIISEFRLTLKMEYEISKNLLALYNYAYDRLVEGNMNEDITKLEEAKDILSELRDAWNQAMKAVKNEKGGA